VHLFIDTNVFLSFLHYSSDDLEELKKLEVLLRDGGVRLLLPDQVVAEFRRNREGKLADSLKKLREVRLAPQFPQICKDYPEYEELRRHQRAFEETHTRLVEKIVADIEKQSLKADGIIRALFAAAQRIETSPALVARARLRSDIGNPPGKKGSLGDAVNWEALLTAAAAGEDLYLVSSDNDYSSDLNEERLDPFLAEEWETTAKSRVIYFKRLSLFLRAQFPEIKLAAEAEKDLVIRDLADSGSFAQTHVVVARLRQYTDFTPSQLNEIVAATLANNQVHWIAGDEDVHSFLSAVIAGREDQIDPARLKELRELLDAHRPAADVDS
jgi:predicted nucleic acid-binding protein